LQQTVAQADSTAKHGYPSRFIVCALGGNASKR
jgi:hypothetical protein